MTFKFCNYYALKLLRSETITFSDVTLSNINVVLFYVLSQYRSGAFGRDVASVAGPHNLCADPDPDPTF